jgi:hypothetical protein
LDPNSYTNPNFFSDSDSAKTFGFFQIRIHKTAFRTPSRGIKFAPATASHVTCIYQIIIPGTYKLASLHMISAHQILFLIPDPADFYSGSRIQPIFVADQYSCYAIVICQLSKLRKSLLESFLRILLIFLNREIDYAS